MKVMRPLRLSSCRLRMTSLRVLVVVGTSSTAGVHIVQSSRQRASVPLQQLQLVANTVLAGQTLGCQTESLRSSRPAVWHHQQLSASSAACGRATPTPT